MTSPLQPLANDRAHDDGDPVDIVLAYHQGDVHAAIMKLLEDCQHLRKQLAVTEFAMSRGLTRGWRPKFERVECDKPAA